MRVPFPSPAAAAVAEGCGGDDDAAQGSAGDCSWRPETPDPDLLLLPLQLRQQRGKMQLRPPVVVDRLADQEAEDD